MPPAISAQTWYPTRISAPFPPPLSKPAASISVKKLSASAWATAIPLVGRAAKIASALAPTTAALTRDFLISTSCLSAAFGDRSVGKLRPHCNVIRRRKCRPESTHHNWKVVRTRMTAGTFKVGTVRRRKRCAFQMRPLRSLRITDRPRGACGACRSAQRRGGGHPLLIADPGHRLHLDGGDRRWLRRDRIGLRRHTSHLQSSPCVQRQSSGKG